MEPRTIRNALVSVFDKNGLEPIVRKLHHLGVTLYSTGGTMDYLEGLGLPVSSVESLTGYPSILDGRVKTLHPKVFGGILARREAGHLEELRQFEIPVFDLVIVDLYPFEETVRQTGDESAIIEKIDIGGVSLIRAAAKNYRDVVIVPCREAYSALATLLDSGDVSSTLPQRKALAIQAFGVTSSYDATIHRWFSQGDSRASFRMEGTPERTLRYGENPHQRGWYYGLLDHTIRQLHGKELSYNNLVDAEAALLLMQEFRDADPTTVVIKHTNACGVATRDELLASWEAALAADPVSAFGGIIAVNRELDIHTARAIDAIFYEVLLAPGYTGEALQLLTAKKNRILLSYPASWTPPPTQFRSMFGGILVQDYDRIRESESDLKTVTRRAPDPRQTRDLLFANICVKHLKSNGIALVRDQQLLGMGCGQTSRVDALRQAIAKARAFGFGLEGAVMASDAFFPFPDCVEIAHDAGITAVIHPGGSVRDQDSIDYCDAKDMAMVITGNRHFRHG